MSRELYFDRLKIMTSCEWRLREQATLTGFMWTLLQPALMFGTLYLVFTRWLKVSDPGFASHLLIGVVLYGFFHSATSYGLNSLNRRAPLVLNFVFPREIVVLAACLSVAISHACELALMGAFLCAVGARPTAAWLLLPVLFAAQVAMACGLSLLLAPAAARYLDLERIWAVLLGAGFYLTPIFYRTERVDPARAAILRLNPLTYLLGAARDCLLGGHAPLGAAAALFAAGAVTLAVGLCAFRAREDRLGDDLSRSS